MKGILETHGTFPRLLERNADLFGHGKVAMREKEFGIWQEFSWKEYREQVKYFSLGLVTLGLSRGDKVAIIGDNRPEWVWAEVAAQAVGAVPLGLYQDSTLKEVAYIIDHSDASFVIAEDQEQVDKILDMKEQLPKVRFIIYSDPKGMRGYQDPHLLDFKEVQNSGRDLERRDPGVYERNVEATRIDDMAFICYTSGTTGLPKGAILTFRNLLSMASNLIEVDPKVLTDEFVSFLPLAWIGEQMMCLSSALLTGFSVNFPEKPETVQENIREIGPTIMFSPPRIWENMTSTVQVKVMDASALKRRLYHWALPVGYEYAEAVFRKQPVSPSG
jgi:long-chain acyl-CoA synthetase